MADTPITPSPAPAAPPPPPADLSGAPAAPFTPDQNNVLMSANPAPPPAPAGTPSVWKTMVAGALWGLAGSAGAKHFGAGLAGGARGVLEEAPAAAQRQAQVQAGLQFESVKAADSHILALAQAREADTATEEHKLQLDSYKANIDAFNKALGIKPTITLSADNPADMNAQANGGLQTLAQQNGGKVPEISTVNSPAAASNPNHSIDVYAKPSAQDLQQNPNGYRKLVDTAAIINTGSPVSDEQWNTGNFTMRIGNPTTSGMQMLSAQREGQAQMVTAAQQRLYGVPTPSGNPAKDAATAATLKQQLTQYEKRPDADPNAVKLLGAQLDTFTSAAKDAETKTNQAAAETAKQKELAKESTPGGQLTIRKNIAQTKEAEANASLLGHDNPKVQATAQAVLEGRMSPPGSFALKTPYWQNVMGEVFQQDPQWSEQRAQLRKDFTVGKHSKEINAINTALQHTGVLGNAIDALNNGQVQSLNQIANSIGVQAGKTPTTTFQTIVGRLGPELASAYSVGTGGERETIEKGLSAKMSPDQLKQNISTNVQLLEGKINSLRNQWDQNKGQSMPSFDDRFMTQQAKDVIQRWTGNRGGGPSTGQVRQYNGANYKFDGNQWVKQ